jgi:putative DNA primase/helicase
LTIVKSNISTPYKAELRLAADIPPTPTRWLWEKWIPVGRLLILAGAGGSGKTTLAVSLAATISNGSQWPDGSGCAPIGNVLIWSGEDGIADTVIPRLIAAGANLNRISIIEGRKAPDGKTRAFNPATDFDLLNAEAERIGNVALVILDPLVSLVRGDMHRANDVRQALQSVVEFAERHNSAVIGITHLSKGARQGSIVDRVIGSQAFSALARTVLVAMKSPESETRALIKVKSNLSENRGGIGYVVEHTVVDANIETTRIVWGEVFDEEAEIIISEMNKTSKTLTRSAIQDACEFLSEALQNGSRLATEVEELSEAAGISGATLKRAKRQLGVIAKKTGMDSGWVWLLPEPLTEGVH